MHAPPAVLPAGADVTTPDTATCAAATDMPAKEQLVPIRAAGQRIATELGVKLSHNALYRWVSVGIQVANGERAKLYVRKIGGRIYTHRSAIDQFLAKLDPGAAGTLAHAK